LVLALSLTGTRSLAMPPGREWVPPTEFDPAIAYEAPRLWTDARGMPQLDMKRFPGPVAPHLTPYAWMGDAWIPGADALSPPGAISSPITWAAPLVSREGIQAMAGISNIPDRDGYFRLVLWPVSPGSIGVPETVAVATGQTTGHAAAEAGGHRWVTHPEQFPQDDPPIFHVRTLYSERPGQWRELPRGTDEELMCALAPLDDHHALRVSGGWNAQRWTVLEDDRVAASGVLSQDPHPILTPLIGCLRPRPSGGAWLLWAVHGVPRVSSFRDGVWSAPQDLTVQHPTTPATFYYFSWGDMSNDANERPVIAWIDIGSGPGFIRQVGCIAFPNDNGWDPGDEVPGTDLPGDQEDAAFLSVTRDRFGEAWVAWDTYHTRRAFWTHTQVRSIAADVTVHGNPNVRTVRWSLSEPAPGSAWTVERARDREAFVPVATLRADSGVTMAFTDVDHVRFDDHVRSDDHVLSDDLASLRYRIRRESVDAACVWTSAEAGWSAGHKRHRHGSLAVSTSGRMLHFELTDLPEGAYTLTLFDVQGRVAGRWSRVREAGAPESFAVALDAPGRLGAGVYIVRLAHATAGELATAKVVLLK
jgi:hypothetical protein